MLHRFRIPPDGDLAAIVLSNISRCGSFADRRNTVNAPGAFRGSAMSAVFISYRREDTSGYAGRLYDDLAKRFGKERVFMDIETLQPGLDFVASINREIGACGAILALIGPRWSSVKDPDERPRIDDPHDFVRLEIKAAITRNIRVIPVLVQNAKMPNESDLPKEIAALSRLHAFEISDSRWEFDSGRLIEIIAPLIEADAPPEFEPVERMRASSAKGPGAEASSTGTRKVTAVIVTLAIMSVILGGLLWHYRDRGDNLIPAIVPQDPAARATPPPVEFSVPMPPQEAPEQFEANTHDQRLPDPRPPRTAPAEPVTAIEPARPAASGQADPEAALEARISRLLSEAEQLIAESRLTLPAGNNAYMRFQEILTLEPGHPDAIAGVRRIARRYLELSERAIASEQPERARTFLARAREVAPGEPAFEELQLRIDELATALANPPADERPEVFIDPDCLRRCNQERERCENTRRQPTEEHCFAPREAQCAREADACLNDTHKLLVWGTHSVKSECEGQAQRCIELARRDCETRRSPNGSDCAEGFRQCESQCGR